MTWVRPPRGFWAYGLDWDALGASTPPGIGTATIAGFVFQVPHTGSLEGWEFMAGTGGIGGPMRASLQDLAPTGLPDNGEDVYRDIDASEVTLGAWCTAAKPLTTDGTAGGTRRAVTKGQWLAACLPATGIWAGMAGFGAGSWMDRTAYSVRKVGSVWSKLPAGTAKPNLVLVYSDGTQAIPLLCHGASAIGTYTFTGADSPDEVGILVNLPWTVECDGAAAHVEYSAGSFDVCLYQGASLQRSATFTYPWSSGQIVIPATWERLQLVAHTTYRLTVKPNATTTLVVYEEQFNSTVIAAAAAGGATSGFTTTRTDVGSFSDETIKKLHGFMLHLSGIDT